MLKNYLKIALRQLWKHKLFSALNIFGLAASMSVCLLLILILADQYGYDTFHENGDQVYRVISGVAEKNQEIKRAEWATSSLSLAEELEDNYPFITNTVRLVQTGVDFKIGEKTFSEDGDGFAVDSDFLEVFSFGWIAGDERTALLQPRSVVLTESLAEKFFPYSNPLGATVEMDDLGEFTITGIIPDPPIRSHIFFNYLMSFSTIPSLSATQQANIGINDFDEINQGMVYLLLEEKTNQNKLQEALTETAAAYSLRDQKKHFLFEPQALSEIMPSQDLNNEIGIATPYMVLYFLIGLGILIIFSACFNYMNLSVARSLKRAKEIGIRKVTGASKKDIVFQFLGEAILIAVLALIVAIGLLEFLIPVFYGLDPFVEQVFYLKKTPAIYALYFGFSLLVGLAAGVFPAFNISAFQPIQAIQQLSNVKIFSRVGFRKVLITAQFTLSLIFVLAVILVLQQQKYVMETDLGLNIENLLNVNMKNVDYKIFAQQVSQLKNVEEISASSSAMLSGDRPSVMASFNERQDSMDLRYNIVSPNYFDNLEIELIAGKNFPENSNSQGEQFLILNETAVQRMGYENLETALGQFVQIDTTSLTVLGVVRDFHHDNIWFEPIQPFGFRNSGNYAANANIRISGAETAATIGAVRSIWNQLSPDKPMLAFFVEERVYHLANFFRMGSKIIGFVGFLTILIACLGLLGMVVYTIEGRVKEVGIRKVLGASEKDIIWQLSKGFLWLLGIATVIAIPLTIFGANLWLQNFVLRIQVSPLMILSGIGIILALGLVTVVSQTYLAARANPVESLRNE